MHAQVLRWDAGSPLSLCCAPGAMGTTPVDTLPGLLRHAGLAAALDDMPAGRRRYVVRWHEQRGAWRTVQQASATRTVGVAAGGTRAVRGWQVSGDAALHRDRDDGVQWRNQSEASTSALYVWADSVGGVFRGDQVMLSAAVASPGWHGLTLGVPVELAVGQSARRNDPRPLSRRRVMEVAPSVRWRAGAHQLGVGVALGSDREDLEIGGGLSAETPVVFRLRGISTFDRTQLISADRTLQSRSVGVRGGWARHARGTHVAVTGAVRVATDSVRDGIATPTPAGVTRRVRWDVSGAWRRASAVGGTEWRADVRGEEARGTDPAFLAVNAVRDGTRGMARFAWWRGSSPTSAVWRFDVEATHATVGVRDVAGEAGWRVTRVPIAVAVQRRTSATRGWQWFAAIAGGYTVVPAEQTDLLRTSRITPLFVTHDQAMHAATTTIASWRVGMEQLAVRAAGSGDRGVAASPLQARVSLGWDAAWAHVALPASRGTWGRHAFTMQLELL